MKLSPLQLAYYRVVELSVSTRFDIDPMTNPSDAIQNQIDATLQFNHDVEEDDEETSAWTINLSLDFVPEEKDNSPYEFHVGLFGVFRCSNILPAGLDAERMVGINGTSVIYGIARELIHGITEKSLWGDLTLPTMSFTDFREMLPKEESNIEDRPRSSITG